MTPKKIAIRVLVDVFTANFADTYSRITVLLYDGELTSGVALEHARCLGRVGVHLFDSEREMPTSRDMHDTEENCNQSFG